MELGRIWVFGDSRVIPGLKNAAMDAFIKRLFKTWQYPEVSVINFTYQNTVESAALRKFLVDFVVRSTAPIRDTQGIADSWKAKRRQGLNAEYRGDLALSLLRTFSVEGAAKCWLKNEKDSEVEGA